MFVSFLEHKLCDLLLKLNSFNKNINIKKINLSQYEIFHSIIAQSKHFCPYF